MKANERKRKNGDGRAASQPPSTFVIASRSASPLRFLCSNGKRVLLFVYFSRTHPVTIPIVCRSRAKNHRAHIGAHYHHHRRARRFRFHCCGRCCLTCGGLIEYVHRDAQPFINSLRTIFCSVTCRNSHGLRTRLRMGRHEHNFPATRLYKFPKNVSPLMYVVILGICSFYKKKRHQLDVWLFRIGSSWNKT